MKYSVAQIGKHRLEKVLANDKSTDPRKILNLLKSDIKNVLESYAIINGEVIIEVDEEIDGLVICMQAKAERLKSFGNVIY